MTSLSTRINYRSSAFITYALLIILSISFIFASKHHPYFQARLAQVEAYQLAGEQNAKFKGNSFDLLKLDLFGN